MSKITELSRAVFLPLFTLLAFIDGNNRGFYIILTGIITVIFLMMLFTVLSSSFRTFAAVSRESNTSAPVFKVTVYGDFLVSQNLQTGGKASVRLDKLSKYKRSGRLIMLQSADMSIILMTADGFEKGSAREFGSFIAARLSRS